MRLIECPTFGALLERHVYEFDRKLNDPLILFDIVGTSLLPPCTIRAFATVRVTIRSDSAGYGPGVSYTQTKCSFDAMRELFEVIFPRESNASGIIHRIDLLAEILSLFYHYSLYRIAFFIDILG